MPVELSDAGDGVSVVVLSNEARRNALDLEMFRSLAELWPRLAATPSLRAVVIRGQGDLAFCSGADLSARLHEVPGIDDLVERALLKTAFFPKPLIAAINGACVAGGLELALAADIRIGSSAAQYGLPEVRWGIMPSGGSAMKLIDQVGYTDALDLLLTGRLIDGTAAERMGLITMAAPPGEVLPLAIERARAIAANSPVAVQAAKKAALSRLVEAYRQGEALERELTKRVRASGHQAIGEKAFLSKQMPVYGDE